MYKFITLTNGKRVQAFFEAEEDQVAKIVGSKFDFKTLSDGKIAQKIAFVDADGNKVELFIAPFSSDLDTWYKTITDKIFAESIENLPGQFLPRVASLNGTDALVDYGVVSIGKLDWTINLWFKLNDVIGTQTVLSKDNFSPNIDLRIDVFTNDLVVNITSNNVATNRLSYTKASAFIADTWYMLSVTFDVSTKTIKAYINSTEQGASTVEVGTFVEIADLASLAIGAINRAVPLQHANIDVSQCYIYDFVFSQAQVDNIILGVFPTEAPIFASSLSGQGDYEYNLVDNTYFGTWAGTGPRFAYALEGSDYPNGGYSLWEHATADPIQVSFDLDGNALNLTAGVNIPTGYTHSYDLLPAGSNHNIYDSLINLNPTGSLDPALEVYNRSNVTIQTAASRASIYYDNTDRTTSSIYHISEITNPVIYDTFFEATSKDKVFGKVVLDGSDNIILYKEQLQYGTQKAGADLVDVTDYCGITSIYP